MRGEDLFIIVFILCIFGGGALICVDVIFAIQENEFNNYNIISLKDTASVNGRFALGSGFVNEKPSFMYYQVVDNGYRLKSVPADRTTIIEDENDKPYIKELLVVDYGRLSGSRTVICYRTTYEIHVPKDTIVKDFSLNSEK